MPRHHSFRSENAFSLIEVVMALGIISFALVAILGLMPVGVQSAMDSQRETQVALIARSIFTDLQGRRDPTRFIVVNTKFSEDGDLPKSDLLNVDLSSEDSDFYLSYDSDGLPKGKIDESAFSSGKGDAGYVAHVQIKKLSDQSDPTIPDSEGLTEVQVAIEAPGAAAKDKRTSYPFITLLRQGTALSPSPQP
jgi:type II secretory pathway pseudopilin PulG